MAALLGVALVAAGVLLAPRPLTTLLVLVLLIAAALLAWSIRIALHARGRTGAWLGAALLLIAAAAIVVLLSEAVRGLSVAAAVILVANAVRLLWRATREGTVAGRLVRTLFALACIEAAVIAWLWPDIALVVIAVAFALTLVVAGVACLISAARGGRHARSPRPRLRAVLRTVGAVAVVALVTGGGILSVQLRASASTIDDVYSWQGGLPTEPGVVLRVGPYAGAAPAGATTHRILYSTTHADGTMALASAVVAIPDAAGTDRPVLAWQHGTTGVAQQCGPSTRPDALTEAAIPGISRAIERGWIVVATDYPGQGTPGRYPYLVGEGEGRATLDAVRAVQRLDDARASGRTLLWGHSQGGHATLWAAQIAPSYAPELDIVSVAALSAAVDPLEMARRVTAAGAGAVSDVITSYVLVPYADEYRDIRLSDIVHPAGLGFVEAYASRCAIDTSMIVSALSAVALGMDAPLYRIDLEAGPTHDRLAENIASGEFAAPLFLGQGEDDEVIPISMQRTFSAALCAQGRAVETHEYPGRTHMGVIAEGSPLIDDLFAWVDRVMAGEAPSNCG